MREAIHEVLGSSPTRHSPRFLLVLKPSISWSAGKALDCRRIPTKHILRITTTCLCWLAEKCTKLCWQVQNIIALLPFSSEISETKFYIFENWWSRIKVCVQPQKRWIKGRGHIPSRLINSLDLDWDLPDFQANLNRRTLKMKHKFDRDSKWERSEHRYMLSLDLLCIATKQSHIGALISERERSQRYRWDAFQHIVCKYWLVGKYWPDTHLRP
jgi:hypothetical protein